MAAYGKTFDVIALGNAIVDVLAFVDTDFLSAHNIPKGSTALVDERDSESLYNQFVDNRHCAGGASANSAVGVSLLGGTSGFMGVIKDDPFGAVFAGSLTTAGVLASLETRDTGPGTGRCLVMVTPDAERTMRTYLGAGQDIAASCLQIHLIPQSTSILIEGYLAGSDHSWKATNQAIKAAKQSGTTVAFSLSDVWCVKAHQARFSQIFSGGIDILLTNEPEMLALLQKPCWLESIEIIRTFSPVTVITRGAKGSAVVTPEGVYHIARRTVDEVVDTTGAGDLYAGGFLFALAKGHAIPVAAQVATLAASEVIRHLGARPQTSLRHFMETRAYESIDVRVDL